VNKKTFIESYGNACAMVSEEILKEYFRRNNYKININGLESADHITDCWIMFCDGIQFGINLK
jgi:hypothetical protein